MPYSVDEFLATIAHSGVAHIPASVAKEVCQCRKRHLRGCSLESMARVVTVLVASMAFHAKIVIVAGSAGNKLLLGHDCANQNSNSSDGQKERLTFNAAVASTGGFIFNKCGLCESSGHILFHCLLNFRL